MSNPFLPPNEPDANKVDPSHQLIPNDEDRNLALLAHLSGCAGVVMGGFVGFIGPLVVYLIYKDKSAFVESQAKEALNFQITLFIVGVVCIAVFFASCGTLFPLLFVPSVLQVVFGIIAAVAVRDGQPYHYPFNLRLFR